WRFVHHHGQRCARLERTQSILRQGPADSSWLMRTFSLAFFLAPNAHLRDIRNVYVDGIILAPTWKRHIQKLQEEWQEFVLYATVMLNANVAFLSIPDVLIFPNNSPSPVQGSNIQSYLMPLRSPAAIASYVSILFSAGSIVLGLMLIRHNRTRHRENAGEAVEYMDQLVTIWFGYEPLAILYSLPYALLMWAMASFLAAILIFTLSSGEIATQITVATVFFVVTCLICWCTLQIWDKTMTLRELLEHIVKLARRGRPNGARAHGRKAKKWVGEKTKMWTAQMRYARQAREFPWFANV
ncbi:hypothetical protein K488DRAFT_43208, partial [Vararia minispora EC-137]